MKTSAIALAALAVGVPLALSSPAAWAAGDAIPASGSTTYTTYYLSHALASTDLGEGSSQAVVEFAGITRNVAGQKVFDNMLAHCVGLSTTTGGKPAGFSGSCTETDGDGDKVFTTFDGLAHTLVGGTGKYKGISGSAPYTVTPAPAPGPGQFAVAVEHKVTWQIK